MAEKSTFIKIDRNIIHWRWFGDKNTLSVFLWLLINANIEDHDFENVTIHRGEVATSFNTLARENFLTMQEARTAIAHLKSTREITSKRYAKFQVFSILKYDSYQGGSTSKSTSKSTINQQSLNNQSTINQQQLKNVKKLKNKKNICGSSGDDETETSGDEWSDYINNYFPKRDF